MVRVRPGEAHHRLRILTSLSNGVEDFWPGVQIVENAGLLFNGPVLEQDSTSVLCHRLPRVARARHVEIARSPFGHRSMNGLATLDWGRDPNRLHLKIFLDRIEATFPAEPTALVAADGRRKADCPIGVDPHRSHTKPLGHAHDASHVLGPDAGGQTAPHVVDDLDNVLLVIERHNSENRPKHLLLCDPHLVSDIDKDRRLDKMAATRPGTDIGTTTEDARGPSTFAVSMQSSTVRH